MAERIGKNLWRLDIPLVGNPLKNLNSYLLTGPRSLLIDTGFRQDPCRAAMEDQLEEIGVDRDRLDIFLTHLHSDHTGLAPELIRPGCRVYIGRVDGARLTAPDQEGRWRNIFAEYVRNGFSPEEMERLWDTNPAKVAAPPPWDGYTFLEDGDVLTYGESCLRCVLTPGHTPGHLCLYDGESRRLFCGDHVLFHITPQYLPVGRCGGLTGGLSPKSGAGEEPEGDRAAPCPPQRDRRPLPPGGGTGGPPRPPHRKRLGDGPLPAGADGL